MPSSNDLFRGATAAEGARADQYQQAQQSAQNRYLDALNGGSGAVAAYTQAAMSSAMPQFSKSLQGVRESASRRGVANGELGTSYEGDLASAFQRNIANATASQAVNVYGQQTQGYGNVYNTTAQQSESSSNRYLDALSGQRDYDTAQANANAAKKRNKWGTIGSIAGGVIGSVVPGLGTAVGASLGGALGGAAGGW